MRKIITKDAFALARIIKKANIRKEVAEFAMKASKGANEKEVGLEFFILLIESASEPSVEKEIYTLIASISETDEKELPNKPLPELFEIIKEIVKENDLSGFFTQAFALMQ